MKTLTHQPHIIVGVQFKSRVGALGANCAFMRDEILSVRGRYGAQPVMLLFPEMAVSGYPLQDQVLTDAFIVDCWTHLIQDILPVLDETTAALIGLPLLSGGKRYNAVVLASGGKILHVFTKVKLPNTSVFDEARTFSSGRASVYAWKGITYGVPICEDIWTTEVCVELRKQGAQILLSPNGSPSNVGKWRRRKAVIDAILAATGLPLLYVNRWGGQDELVFDGRSVLMVPGEAPQMADMFTDAHIVFAFDGQAVGEVDIDKPVRDRTLQQERYDHLQTGMDYVRYGRGRAVVSLSGGVDSTVVLAEAVDALGADNVLAISQPSGFSSDHSRNDARRFADALGVRMETLEIEDSLQSIRALLSVLGPVEGITDENLQARLRGLNTMSASNMGKGWVLTTGNKSEMAVGYATLYGDMNGAFNPIKDLYKTEVFDHGRFRAQRYRELGNTDAADVLLKVVNKPASAELRPDQFDSDSLPPYPVLDKVLFQIVELRKVPREIFLKGIPRETIQRVYDLVDMSEFKRRQACPGIRWHGGDLDKDRRFPLDKAGWKPLDTEDGRVRALMDELMA
ncbi:MAG: NAD+ synthase [Pseudomonas fluorescens]|nr:MAG: NAD+ synthase [Pseudomonas fluorescens]